MNALYGYFAGAFSFSEQLSQLFNHIQYLTVQTMPGKMGLLTKFFKAAHRTCEQQA